MDINKKRLAQQLDAAQHILDSIRVTSGCAATSPSRTNLASRVELAAQTARRALQERQCRVGLVGDQDMHADPAWDILLNIFVRQAEDRVLTLETVTSNCFSHASTASRWLKALEQKRLVRIMPDRAEGNRQVVRLTSTGFEEMLRYFEAIARLDAEGYDPIDHQDWGEAGNNFQ